MRHLAQPPKRGLTLALALAGMMACTLALAGTVNTITVTTTSDTLDAFDQACSLREALQNANTNAAFSPVVDECPAGILSGTDRIALANGATYILTRPGTGDDDGDLDALNGSDLVENAADLRIDTLGPGAAAIIRQQVTGQRVIEIQQSAMEVENVTIEGGSIDGGGGGILNDRGFLYLTRATVQGNTATAGGGLYTEGTTVLTDSLVQLNSATFVGGGGIFHVGNQTLQLLGSTVRSNSAPTGGGIHVNATRLFLEEGSQVRLNTASGNGGGIAAFGSTQVGIWSTTFQDNESGASGGAVYTESNLRLMVGDSDFISNQALNGGAVRTTTAATFTASDTDFVANSALVDGGAIHAIYAELLRVDLRQNSAFSRGGAILGVTTIDVVDSILQQNGAEEGGAIRAQILNLSGSVVSANQASSDGGGVYVSNFAVVEKSNFISNTAQGDGGALRLGQGAEDSRLTQSLVFNNTALGDGGGLWADGTLRVANTTISGNSAGQSGGGIHIPDGALTIATHVTLANNGTAANIAKYGDLELRNSILSSPAQPDCVAALKNPEIVSFGNNLSDDGSCVGLDEPGDRVDTDAMLAAIDDNGGDTLTHALLPGSPAIDRALTFACIAGPVGSVDQRGRTRQPGPACDVGAHEQGATVDTRLFADGLESP
jgi:CSLREA domain-containing protein